MFKSGLWYSKDALDSAMQDLKSKLRSAYTKDNFDSWWDGLTFGQYSNEIVKEIKINPPGSLEIGIKRALKATPALACCLVDKSSDLILKAIFSKDYSVEESDSIESSLKEFSEGSSVTNIFKDYFASSTISCGVVSATTLFSTMILDKAINKKGWKESIWDALKNAGVWSVAYVAGAVGEFAGSLVEDEFGKEITNISVSAVSLFFAMTGVKYLADIVRKIRWCKDKKGFVINQNFEVEVDNT